MEIKAYAEPQVPVEKTYHLHLDNLSTEEAKDLYHCFCCYGIHPDGRNRGESVIALRKKIYKVLSESSFFTA